VAGYSSACAPVALLMVSQVRKDGLMLFIRVGYAPGGFGARTAPLLRRRRTPRFSTRSVSLLISLISPIWRSISRFSHLQYPLALPCKMSMQVHAQRRRQRSEDVGVRSVRHRRTSDLDHILTDCAQVPAYTSLRISQKTGLVETSTKPYLCAVGSAGITRLHHIARTSR
jgi:hypothetical protein